MVEELVMGILAAQSLSVAAVDYPWLGSLPAKGQAEPVMLGMGFLPRFTLFRAGYETQHQGSMFKYLYHRGIL